jgi:exopolysaccharide production protein ExoZ
MQAVRPAPGAPRQFLSIQYLRALAALGVVIFHASPADNLFMVGNAGVDIFFVISGFIMWSITEERPTSPAAFIRDRLIRIAPLYWLLTTLLVVGVLVAPKLFPNLKIDLPFVVGSYLFVPMRPPGSTGADPIWPVLVQGWTLNYEMFFYVLFSACLFLRPSLRLAALSLILLGCVISGLFYGGSNALVLSFTDPIFLEFLAGILLAVCLRRGLLPSRAWGYGFVALGVILLLGCAMGSVTQPRLLAWGLPAVLLVGGALILETTGRIPQLPWLRMIGDSSYSLYLTHGLAISVLGKIMTRSWLFSFVGVIAAIGVGICFWYLMERRATGFLKKSLAAPRAGRYGAPALSSRT